MTWWQRWRTDLARPETAVAREELPFLIGSAVLIVLLAQLSHPGSAAELAAVALAGALLATRPLVPRVPAELVAAGIAGLVAAAVGAGGDLEVAFFLGVMMTLYGAWHLGSTTRAAAVALLASAAPCVAVLAGADIVVTPWVSANLFTFVLGRNLRRQRALIQELEAAREALAEQAVAEERRRIARELHDLAGHTLAAVLLHVTGARHVLRRDVDEAEQALREAEAVGRASLDQIRATVAHLRTSERGTDPALPASADLGEVVEEYRRAGLVVDAHLPADAGALRGPVGVALQRICREALANVARHAPANRVEVVLGLDADGAGAGVQLHVVDRGRPPGPAATGAGHFGLVGMRERAVGLGGEFAAGPHADGWRVDVWLPLVAAGDRAEVGSA